ncbi:MAG: sigma-54-dependent Fis family transcriptional regulator [Alphaproteobacteria bacterium]|nr:MAG: sigma-54-dependent Fis family transcriptional regulator [Alphaproteobacteria bacterium]
MTRRILVVDDEPTTLRLIGTAVENAGFQAVLVRAGAEALQLLQSPDASAIDAVILDLSMPGTNGFDVLRTVHPRHPDLPFIVLTAHSSIANAVDSMRAGAVDFLVKPASGERIASAIRNALDNRGLQDELRPLSEKLGKPLRFAELVGDGPAMRDAIAVARKAAATDIPVLIEGESGVGKELFARAIYTDSPRSQGPFVTVNCGAIPANLVESILFGHEKGAFTGATSRHIGKFAEADGGTIFLDEVGELPLDVQVKLLRVLQEGEVDPVGGAKPVKVDVRVISATNRVLADQVRAGSFREDLYYRLAVFPVRIPPLRKRPEDIPALVAHFLDTFAASQSVRARGVLPSAMALLQGFAWPGNVRQLQNAIFRAAVLADGEQLAPEDFPFLAAQAEDDRADADDGPVPAAATPGWSGSLPVLDEDGHIRAIADIEADLIRFALARYRGRMSEIARRLGIGRSTLYRKVADLDGANGDVPQSQDASGRETHPWPN